MNPKDIIVGERLRPLNADRVAELERSITALGLQTPITIRYADGHLDSKPTLIAGAHRLQAVKNLGWDKIPVRVFEGDDREARMWEIAENLHRAELTALEHDMQLAEWVRLAAQDKMDQAEPVSAVGGRGNEGGIRRAARELDIDRNKVVRAMKTDSLAPEAKAKAVELGLDDNRSALLKAAKAETAEEQVEALKQRKERKRAAAEEQPAPKAESGEGTEQSVTSHVWPNVTEELERLTKAAEVMCIGLDDVLRAHPLHKVGTPELCAAIKSEGIPLDAAAAMLLAVPRIELSELPFAAALAQFKKWYSALTHAEQLRVEQAMGEVEEVQRTPERQTEPELQAEPDQAEPETTTAGPDLVGTDGPEPSAAQPDDRANQLVSRLNALPGVRPKWCRERLDKPEDAINHIKNNAEWSDARDWLTAFIACSPKEQAAIRALVGIAAEGPAPHERPVEAEQQAVAA